jgi:hypothetical protein
MRWLLVIALACPLIGAVSAAPARAAAPVPVAFGTSWDGAGASLQTIVDQYLGVSGAIDVETDFLGAKPGDLDPWFWVGANISALLVTEIAGQASHNVLGWYLEEASAPVIDGVGDGIVFNGSDGNGAAAVVVFPNAQTKFGFYLDPNGSAGAPNAPQPEVFTTNRFWNDKGPSGTALHVPTDGDVQALIFDVSRWKGPNTWLVCFEDVDSGAPVSPCCTGTDNDFNDLVFQVTALGATDNRVLSFGALKQRYAR